MQQWCYVKYRGFPREGEQQRGHLGTSIAAGRGTASATTWVPWNKFWMEKLGRLSSLENKDTSQSSVAVLCKRVAENTVSGDRGQDVLGLASQQQEPVRTGRASRSFHFFTALMLRVLSEGHCGECVIPGFRRASFSKQLPWNVIWLLRNYSCSPQQVFVFVSVSKQLWHLGKARLPAPLRHCGLQVWKNKCIWHKQ